MALRKFSEITNSKPIFSQYNIFSTKKYSFFQFDLTSFQSLPKKPIKPETMQSVLQLALFPCFVVHSLRAVTMLFQYFRTLKEIGVSRSVFPDYVISCDCNWTKGKREGVTKFITKTRNSYYSQITSFTFHLTKSYNRSYSTETLTLLFNIQPISNPTGFFLYLLKIHIF